MIELAEKEYPDECHLPGGYCRAMEQRFSGCGGIQETVTAAAILGQDIVCCKRCREIAGNRAGDIGDMM